MKLHLLSIAIAAWVSAAVPCLRAQTPAANPAQAQVELPDAAAEKADKQNAVKNENKPEKPEKPERPDQAAKGGQKDVIHSLRDEFKVKAEDYQRQQKELLAQMKNANAEERARLRQELKELKEQFKDLGQELREKAAELREKIDRETINDTKSGGRPREK